MFLFNKALTEMEVQSAYGNEINKIRNYAVIEWSEFRDQISSTDVVEGPFPFDYQKDVE